MPLVRVEADPAAPVHPVDRGHLLLGQLETEQVEVLLQPLPAARLREDDVAELQVPAQHHLLRGDAVRLRGTADARVGEDAPELAGAERTPRLDDDAPLPAELAQLLLLQPRLD